MTEEKLEKLEKLRQDLIKESDNLINKDLIESDFWELEDKINNIKDRIESMIKCLDKGLK